MLRLTPLACLGALTLLLAGCGKPPAPRFHLNMVSAINAKVDAPTQQQVANVLEALFGTPDQPLLPPDVPFKKALIARAAGPVASDIHGRKVGLFREHCVHCHGISGDGMGPTAAFLNPYPRDYRPGVFKFKSTAETSDMPTDADLAKVLEEGIPGTSMPSFRMLAVEDRQALVEYVKYLALRGQTERKIYAEQMITVNDKGQLDTELTKDSLGEMYSEAAGMWQAAQNKILKPASSPPAGFLTDPKYVEMGHKLFFGAGDCKKCHGTTALGDGQVENYDFWTTEVDKALKANKDNSAELALIQEYSLKPRHILPRNLRSGIYRGGRRPIDLYYRILAGISGSGMPGHANQLKTPEEQWAIIAYVLSLPYDAGGALRFEQEQIAPVPNNN